MTILALRIFDNKKKYIKKNSGYKKKSKTMFIQRLHNNTKYTYLHEHKVKKNNVFMYIYTALAECQSRRGSCLGPRNFGAPHLLLGLF